MKRTKRTFNLILSLALWLMAAQTAWADDVVYETITEVPTIDGGQASNWGSNGSENYDKVVDGKTNTKYGLSNADPWVEFHYSRAFVPKRYVLWTADDTNGERNPSSWTIMAKLNKTDAWTTIATVNNSNGTQLPKANNTSKTFYIEDNTNAYKYFRFEATRSNSSSNYNQFQLAELQFVEASASAKTEVTWYMDGGKNGHSSCTFNGNTADVTSDQHSHTLRYTWTSGDGLSWRLNSLGIGLAKFDYPITNGCVVTFPDIIGTVTGLTITNLQFFNLAGYTMKMYVGKRGTTPTLLTTGGSDYLVAHSSSTAFTATFTGSIDVDADHPLAIWFDGEELDYGEFTFGFSVRNNNPSPTIQVAYTPAAIPDAGHVFTSTNISASGNVLTTTCSSTDAAHNALYGANHQYTLTLNAEDGMASIINPVSASITPSLSDFNTETQLGAICTIEYATQGASDWTTVAPRTVGNYTARATIRINNTNYVLTTNFHVIEGHYITNDYSQLSVNKTGAMAGENITVIFTPQMGESVETLTVTGDNTNLNLDNGITDNHDNTYTFAMPNENVTLGATFTFPMDADNFAQDGDTYTIKNADGWDYFCQRIQYDANIDGFSGKTIELAADNITVTTMAGMMHPFKGTFDGKGNMLDFKPTTATMYCAPFQNTNGATICNLHVTGLIVGGTNSFIGGLIGSSEGDLTIRDCRVSTLISTKYDSNTNSSNVGIGGIVGYIHYTTYGQKCQITGCVYDGLIYNPESSGSTYGCGGFVGCLSEYGHVDLTDCLFIEGQYDNNGGKRELLWGHDNNMNSTFFHRTNNQGEGTLKNCFFVATHFLKQGSPAVESATAPTNFAHLGAPTNHCFMQTYGRLMVFNNKYYTPTYGDLVETYDFSGVKSYNLEYDDKPLGIPDITTPLWGPLLCYKRTFTNGKPVTVMLPFNFTKSTFKKSGSSDGLTGHFYEFKGIHLDPQTSKWTAEMGEPDNPETTTMTANTPYLYVPDEEPEYWYIYNGGDGVNIFTQGNEGGTKVKPYDGRADFAWNKWDFIGTYQPRYWSETEHFEEVGKVYGFAGSTKEVQGVYNNTITVEAGEFVRAKSGAKIRPTSCYLMWTGYEPDYARALTRGAAADEELPQRITVKLVSASGDLNAIGEIDMETGEFDFSGWYTLDGVRLDGKPSTKGIYINNGKKVVIK